MVPSFSRLAVVAIGTNSSVRVLLLKKERVQGSCLLVFTVPRAGANDSPKAFLYYGTTSYSATVHSKITPLYGESYTLEDYTYNGETYQSILIELGSSEAVLLNVYGVASHNTLIVE